MIDKLINDISIYIKWLKQNKDYNITIHLFPIRFKYVMDSLIEFNIHNNPYCLSIKSREDIWDRCVKSQKKIIDMNTDEPFFGMCHAGICEFVFPLKANEMLGFISITGYCSETQKAKKRLKRIAADACISEKKLLSQYMLCTKKMLPDFNEMKALIWPLCHMIYRLDKLTSELHYDKDTFLSNEEFMVNQLVAYINRNFSSKLTLECLSKSCHCSKSTVSRIFKSHMDITIMDYILQVRMKEAKKLLSDTVFSVQEIGEICGFCDGNYFSYNFKKQFGITPTEYRKKYT